MVTILTFFSVYYFASNLFLLVLLRMAFRLVRGNYENDALKIDYTWPSITVVISAYNEEATIYRAVKSLSKVPYKNLEVLVVNDGSRDGTFELLKAKFKLSPSFSDRDYPFRVYQSHKLKGLIVIDQENLGKANALNNALLIASGKYIVTLDADTVVEKDAFFHAIQLIESDDNCHAVGGTLRVLNGAVTDPEGVRRGHLPESKLAMFQVIEYIRSFFGGRLGWECLGGTALLAGAFAVFRANTLRIIGGFAQGAITEDFEVIIRMKHYFISQKRPCSIKMFPSPSCWTAVPETLKTLFWQRVRWQRGLVKTLWIHRSLIFNFKAGAMGIVTLPYMLLFEALSPIVEFLAIGYIAVAIYFDWNSISLVGIGIGLGVLYYTFITLVSIHLEEANYARHRLKRKSIRKFILFALLESIGYRQFLSVARLLGTLSFWVSQPKWGSHERELLDEKRVA